MNKITISNFLMVVVLIIMLAFSGCTSGNAASQTMPGQYNPNAPGNASRNMTAAQRQEIMQQRQQEAISACQGKQINESCSITGPRNMTGKCSMQAEVLACTVNFGGRQPRDWAGQP